MVLKEVQDAIIMLGYAASDRTSVSAAELLGCSRQRVQRVLGEHGIKGRGPKKPETLVDIIKAAQKQIEHVMELDEQVMEITGG